MRTVRTLALLTIWSCMPAIPAQGVPGAVAECLACHEDPDMSLTLGDGSELSVYIDAVPFLGSVHGEAGVSCTDCHPGYDDDHPFGDTWETARDYAIASYEACKECHFDTYTRTLESVHYELMKEGLDVAPLCTDCHGAHDVENPDHKRAMIDRSCGACHGTVYDQYAESVHGHALSENGPDDVPGCADCHESHSIEPPTTVRFRLKSPDKCIHCHSDPEMMGRYGLSTYVATSYLKDFHGVTASLALADEDAEVDPRQVVVTCVDCHGHHEILSPRELGEEAMKATVVEACASCHADAAPDFPSAWLSHYEPSFTHAPLVYLINLFYWFVIPFVVGGLALQVVLHLFRIASGR